jgi:hypothetical protein
VEHRSKPISRWIMQCPRLAAAGSRRNSAADLRLLKLYWRLALQPP